MRRSTGRDPVGVRLPPRESDKGVGTGNTGGMRGAKRKQIYSSPFEVEWAGLNHRIFHARLGITFKWLVAATLFDAAHRIGGVM